MAISWVEAGLRYFYKITNIFFKFLCVLFLNPGLKPFSSWVSERHLSFQDSVEAFGLPCKGPVDFIQVENASLLSFRKSIQKAAEQAMAQ